MERETSELKRRIVRGSVREDREQVDHFRPGILFKGKLRLFRAKKAGIQRLRDVTVEEIVVDQ